MQAVTRGSLARSGCAAHGPMRPRPPPSSMTHAAALALRRLAAAPRCAPRSAPDRRSPGAARAGRGRAAGGSRQSIAPSASGRRRAARRPPAGRAARRRRPPGARSDRCDRPPPDGALEQSGSSSARTRLRRKAGSAFDGSIAVREPRVVEQRRAASPRRCVEQRPHDAPAPRRDARHARRAAPAQQVDEHGLGRVVERVGGGDQASVPARPPPGSGSAPRDRPPRCERPSVARQRGDIGPPRPRRAGRAPWRLRPHERRVVGAVGSQARGRGGRP